MIDNHFWKEGVYVLALAGSGRLLLESGLIPYKPYHCQLGRPTRDSVEETSYNVMSFDALLEGWIRIHELMTKILKKE